MDEVTSFSILKKCSIIPKAMKSIICSTSRNFLFVWSFHEVYVYEYKLAIVDGLPELNGYEETFNFGNNIVAVISSEENVYALDDKGSVFLFNLDDKRSNSPDDMDIFEASPGEEADRQQSLIGSLDKCDELLAVTEVAAGFASCSIFKQKLIVQIWRVHPLLEKITEHSITDASPCQVFLSYNRFPISAELKWKHFNSLQKGEENVLLVGLGSGQVQSLPHSKKSQSNLSNLLSTPYSISSVNWIADKSRHSSIAVLVQFVHGAAMILHEGGSQTIYLSGPVHISLFDASCMSYVTSDGVDCVVTKLQISQDEDVNYECSVSPLKGVRSMCELPNSNLVLVGTHHKCVYWLNPSLPSTGDATEFVMPDDRLLDALLASTGCLENICLKMEKEDAIIRAVALVKRAPSMRKFFSVLVKVYAGSCHAQDRLKVRVETSCDFVDFSNHVWQLELTVVAPEGGASEIVLKKLRKSFNCDSPVICEMETGLVGIGSQVQCSMVASIEAGQPWLVFPIGKIKLDAGYFLNVVNHVLPKSNAGVTSQSILSPNETIQKVDTVLTMTLSASTLNDQLLFQKMLFNSSHRMTKDQWISLKDITTTSVNASIGNDSVYIRLDRAQSSLKISSSCAEICHRARQAILSRIVNNDDVCLEEKVYVDAEEVRLSFEVAKLKMDLEPKTLKTFKDQIRNISKNLPT